MEFQVSDSKTHTHNHFTSMFLLLQKTSASLTFYHSRFTETAGSKKGNTIVRPVFCRHSDTQPINIHIIKDPF